MLKFFRQIRQRLLNENQFSKYLLYALGEIFLIVIGIWIALQLNNWNESSKALIIEKDYLIRLHDDLQQDSIYFKERREHANELLSQYQKYIDRSYENQTDYESFSQLLCCIDFPPAELSVHKTTYSELISTGNLNIIQDSELREAIGNHYETFEKRNRHLIEFDSYANIVLGNNDAIVLISKHLKSIQNNLPRFETYMLDNGQWRFINDPQSIEFRSMENTVSTYHHKFKTFITYLNVSEQNTYDLLLRIENEIR